MIDKQSKTDKAEHDFITLAMRDYSNLVEVVPFEICIPTRAELEKKAGHNIVYAVPQNNADVREIRDIFDALGHHIW